MGTPVQHLVMAGEIWAGALPFDVRRALAAQWGAHLLGHIAPDAQNASGQSRTATHFFNVPPDGQPPAHEQFLRAFPALARASALPRAQAAFVAGYLAHLLLDEWWIRRIFSPYFERAAWGPRAERMLAHNLLRAWLDRNEEARLDGRASYWLEQARPKRWLPFLGDAALGAWQAEIAGQLRPGATLRTADVFAARAGLPPAEFARWLDTPGEMERRVWAHAPQAAIGAFRRAAVAAARRLIIVYGEDGYACH